MILIFFSLYVQRYFEKEIILLPLYWRFTVKHLFTSQVIKYCCLIFVCLPVTTNKCITMTMNVIKTVALSIVGIILIGSDKPWLSCISCTYLNKTNIYRVSQRLVPTFDFNSWLFWWSYQNKIESQSQTASNLLYDHVCQDHVKRIIY